MISVSSNNSRIGIKPQTGISLEFNNMMFDNDIMQGDLTMPLTISYKQNAAFFKFFYGLHRKVRNKVLDDMVIRFRKWPVSKGILDVLSVDKDEISASLRIGFSGLSVLDKKLNQLDLGGDVSFDELVDHAEEKSVMSYPDTNYVFPTINHPDFYGDKNTDFLGKINNYNGTEFITNITANENAMVPFIFLHYLIKQGFAADGYEVENVGFMADDRMKKLIVYNNRALDKIEQVGNASGMRATMTTSLPVTVNGGQVNFKPDNDTTQGYDALSAYDPTPGEYTIQYAGVHFITVKPKVMFDNHPYLQGVNTVKTYLYKDAGVIHTVTNNYNGIGLAYPGFTGYVFVATAGDVGKKLHVKVEFISTYLNHHMTLIPGGIFSVNDISSTTGVNVFDTTLNLVNHVPDITFGEMINAVRKAFSLKITPDHKNKTVRLDYYNDILRQPYKSYEGKSISGHRIEFTNEHVIRSFNFDWNGDDQLEEGNFVTYDPAKYIGHFNSWAELTTHAPPDTYFTGKYSLVLNTNQIYTCKLVPGLGLRWVYFTDAFYDKVIDVNGKVEIKPDVRPLFMKEFYFGVDDSLSYLLPNISQTGSSPEFDLGDNPYSFRLLFYHGLNTDGSFGDGDPYPFASSSVVIPEDAIPGTSNFYTALFWMEFGLLQYGSDFVDILRNGEFFKDKLRMSLPDLLLFATERKMRQEHANFIIKDMKIDLDNQLHEAELTLLKIMR